MPTRLSQFVNVTPTRENYLRGVVLFGLNSASYKFALAKSLLELGDGRREAISLVDLAEPFSRHVCEHLRRAPRQATSVGSRFLDACRSFNDGSLDHDRLIAVTVKLGFNNVIDAFHALRQADLPVRFFVDERRSASPGIRLTGDLFALAARGSAQALAEVEARWRLVETAWSLEISRSLVAYDSATEQLVPASHRAPLVSARDALNGYQKGACFYCYGPVSTVAKGLGLAEVDHLFPHHLQRLGLAADLDQVWNLVLACQGCNRGPGGKSDKTPHLDYVARLEQRNEYLIESHHPLRETLMAQTGLTAPERHRFLQDKYYMSRTNQIAVWRTAAVGDPAL